MLKMFTVYDSKAQTYTPPFYMKTTGEAIRGFHTVLNDEGTEYAKYPADFTLFEVGTFDFQTSQISVLSAPENLGNGAHIQQQKA